MLNNAVNQATLAGGGIAGISGIGAFAGAATGNHGVVGPCLKGTGCGVGISSVAQLIGLVAPGTAVGGGLAAPAAMGWLHFLVSVVS